MTTGAWRVLVAARCAVATALPGTALGAGADDILGIWNNPRETP